MTFDLRLNLCGGTAFSQVVMLYCSFDFVLWILFCAVVFVLYDGFYVVL